MNKQAGNMYDFVTHTWNPIRGKCKHDCSYCYMKRFPQKDLKLDEKTLNENLGKNNFIFVGSSTDLFEDSVNFDHISDVIHKCNDNKQNKYLFQSKNPNRMRGLIASLFEGECILATTIETNRKYEEMGATPEPYKRSFEMRQAKEKGFITAITIEPIMDFDIDELVNILEFAKPDFVNIGADSGKCNLPEPSKEKVLELIARLNKFTKINKKNNISRLIGE